MQLVTPVGVETIEVLSRELPRAARAMNERSGSERMKASSLIAGAILAACATLAPVTQAAPASAPAGASTRPIPVYGVQVVRTTPHDINAFTEGLFFLNG